MCVAAPAVFRLAGWVVLRKVVAGRRDGLARRDVAEILVGERTRVVLDMIEHVQRAMRGIVQQAQSGLIRLHPGLEPACWRNVLAAYLSPARDRNREVVREAAQVGRSRRQALMESDE